MAKRRSSTQTDKYFFFYNGPFSQFHPSRFVVGKRVFCWCEQWIMFNKAMLFKDTKCAREIMKASTPYRVKELGRLVSGYNDAIWSAERFDIVVIGNIYKFEQNTSLKFYLAATRGLELVECSASDTIWGIGRGLNDPLRLTERTWRGLNLLGKALTRVRVKLIGD